MNVLPSFQTERPSPCAQTTGVTTSRDHPLVPAINTAFEDAMALRGRLREELFQIDGFSGRKFRTFMNNFMGELRDPRYLEIGLYHGASFCPAVYKNELVAVGIDNWAEYSGKRDKFEKSLNAFKSERARVTIIEQDFRKVDYAAIGKFNVLFYDGSHAEVDQYDGVLLPQAAMDDKYVLIIDDWNWNHVRKGTMDALKAANVRIDFQLEVRTTFYHEPMPIIHGPHSEWHNGCLIAAISKRTDNDS